MCIRDSPGTPITDMRVKSLMVPPGLPDWLTRHRLMAAGDVTLHGRAWSGAGRAIRQVEVAVQELPGARLDSAAAATNPDNADYPVDTAGNSSQAELEWHSAEVRGGDNEFAWSSWNFQWQAQPGHYRLRCRATDEDGNVQPVHTRWDHSGFGNNVAQTVDVWVERELPATA